MRTLIILAAALFFVACCPKTDKATETAAPVAENQNKMIRLNVTVTTTPENLAEVVEGLNTLAAASRAEEGCRGYEIYQSTIDPVRLIIIETWAGDEALAIHEKTPHFTTILPPLGEKMTLTAERFEF
jgi:quinol monooxygenase YgiN